MRQFMALCGMVFCVVAGGAHAAPATGVTPLLTHDLPGLAGKEGAMVLVDYPPVGQTLCTGIMPLFLCMCFRAV